MLHTTVEDLISILQDTIWGFYQNNKFQAKITKVFDRKFIVDMGYKVHNNKPFSQNQARLALRIISNYSPIIQHKLNCSIEEIEQFVLYAKYKNPPYESIPIPRQVRYLGDGLFGFHFKFHPDIKEDLKKLKPILPYNQLSRYWIHVIQVDHKNAEMVMALIKKYNFEFDEEIEKFFIELCNSEGQKPKIAVNDDKIEVYIPNDEFMSNYLKFLTNLENHAIE